MNNSNINYERTSPRVIQAANGTGNTAITCAKPSIGFAIKNTGAASLTITINAITITVAASETFDDNFNVFNSVTIAATDTFKYLVRGR